MRLVFTLFLLASLAHQCLAQIRQGSFASQAKLKGVVMPVLFKNESTPTALLRIDKVYPDYQTKGFFKIGLLPMVVAEGVTCEIKSPAQVSNILSTVDTWIRPLSGKAAVELKNVTFLSALDTSMKLTAERVRSTPGGSWQLLGRVSLQTSTNQWLLRNAHLKTTGPWAGQLRTASSEGNLIFDLASLCTTQLNQHPP